MKKDTMTVEEAAKRLKIGRNTAYEAVKNKELPSIKLGKRIVIPVKALERMLETGSN